MRIAICEDQPQDAQHLHALLSDFMSEHFMDYTIDFYNCGEALLARYAPGVYQLIFLDVYMKQVTGMQVARHIRKSDNDVIIIMSTVSKEFGAESYTVDAAYYMIKPVDASQLRQAMRRCIDRLEQHARYIVVITNRHEVKIRLKDIICIESQLRACVFNTVSETIRSNISIDQLEERLGRQGMIRCHRSFIINLHHVKEKSDNDFHMRDGTRIPIGKTYKLRANEAYIAHFRAQAKNIRN